MMSNIPLLPIPIGLAVLAIPAFGGAAARYLISTPKLLKNTDIFVSVYFDDKGALGACGIPYWEALMGNDTKRYYAGEEHQMMQDVCNFLDKKENE